MSYTDSIIASVLAEARTVTVPPAHRRIISSELRDDRCVWGELEMFDGQAAEIECIPHACGIWRLRWRRLDGRQMTFDRGRWQLRPNAVWSMK